MRAATEGSLPPVMPQGNLVEVLGREVRQGSPGELMVESTPSRQRRPPCKTNKEMSDEAADAAAPTYLLTYLLTYCFKYHDTMPLFVFLICLCELVLCLGNTWKGYAFPPAGKHATLSVTCWRLLCVVGS